MSDWIPVVGTLGGAVVGAGSAYLIQRRTLRWQERRRWDETRRELYARLRAALESSEDAGIEVFNAPAELEGAELRSLQLAAGDTLNRLAVAASEAQLVCTEATGLLIDAAVAAAETLVVMANVGPNQDEDDERYGWRCETQLFVLMDAISQLTRGCRHELGVT